MFIVDTNVLIEAKNRYYAFDLAPGFWEWLTHAHTQGQIASIKAIYDELTVSIDELSGWAKAHPGFFLPMDAPSLGQINPLMQWAASQRFTPAALAAFTGDDADLLITAFAAAHGHTVVTHEKSRPKSIAQVYIPDACKGLGVPVVDTFTMLRQTGAVLHMRS